MIARRAASVVPPAPVPSAARREEPRRDDPRARPSFRDDDDMTQLLPSSSLRGGLPVPSTPEAARPSRALLDFGGQDDDGEEATRLFDASARGSRSARPSAPPPMDPTLLAARNPNTKKNTLARHSAAVEDDLRMRQLANETGEYQARGGRGVVPPAARPSGPAPMMTHEQQAAAPVQQHAQHAPMPGPAAMAPMPGVVSPSKRPPRNATSTASAFQRTEAEVPPAFAPSARPPASMPQAAWTSSGEQVANIISPPPPRKAASWFMALGVAVAVVVGGSVVLLRSPSTALAASAIADPTSGHAAPLTAELPKAEAPVSSAAVAASAPVVTPPPSAAAVPEPPTYVPGATAAEPEPVAAVAPVADESHASKHSGSHSTPSSTNKVAAKTPTPVAEKPKKAEPTSKPEPTPKKTATAPTPPADKKGKKGEQSDDERKAAEEAKRLAQKQLADEL